MKLKTYYNLNQRIDSPDDCAFTKDEIDRGVHWLYTDVVCPHCEKIQSVSMTGYLGGPCIRCGELTK